MIKYILLDIDGVLNRESDWRRPFTLNQNNLKVFGKAFQGWPVRILLISSWKAGFITKKNAANAPYIRALEEELAVYGLEIAGVLPCKNRGEAVFDFLRNHKDAVCVDDDLSEYGVIPSELKSQFILPDAKYGLREKDLREKIE